MFVPETLRQLIDDSAANPVIQALSRIDPLILLSSLPTLLGSFHEFVNRNRTALFSHLQQANHTATDYTRASTIDFYNACDNLINMSQAEPFDVWNARHMLLSVIEEKNIFSGAQPKIRSILSDKCRLTVDELRSRQSFYGHDAF